MIISEGQEIDQDISSSAGKESACNVRDPGSIPESGRSTREGIGNPLQYSWASLVVHGKESACNEGDLGSILGLGRFPGEGKGYPLQCSGLENSMDFQSRRVGYDRGTFTLTFSVLEFWDDELTRVWDQGAVKSLLQ